LLSTGLIDKRGFDRIGLIDKRGFDRIGLIDKRGFDRIGLIDKRGFDRIGLIDKRSRPHRFTGKCMLQVYVFVCTQTPTNILSYTEVQHVGKRGFDRLDSLVRELRANGK
jgi:hypothetical protein